MVARGTLSRLLVVGGGGRSRASVDSLKASSPKLNFGILALNFGYVILEEHNPTRNPLVYKTHPTKIIIRSTGIPWDKSQD